MTCQKIEDRIARDQSEPRRSSAWPALLLLSAACFVAASTENLPAGMLPQLASGLDVTEATAGWLVSGFALTAAVSAIPLVALTRRRSRRGVLLALLVCFAAANALTAVSASFLVSVGARVLAGLAGGMLWSIVAGFGARLVPAHRTGRAVAVVLGGGTIAFAVGVPLGTWLTALLGWRTTWWLMAVLAAVLTVAARVVLPDLAGDRAGDRAADRAESDRDVGGPVRLLRRAGMSSVLAASICVGLGHNALFTYVAPVSRAAGSAPVGVVLLIFGVSSVVGVLLGGRLLDDRLRAVALTTGGGLVAVTIAYALGASVFSGSLAVAVVLAAACPWGMVFGAIPATSQTATLRLAPDAPDVAVSLAITVYNVGIAAGAFVAGQALASLGAVAVPVVAGVVGVVGVVVIARSRTAFRS